MLSENSPRSAIDTTINLGQISEEQSQTLLQFAQELPTHMAAGCFEKIALCFVGDDGALTEVAGDFAQIVTKLKEQQKPAKMYFKLKQNYLFVDDAENSSIGIKKEIDDGLPDSAVPTSTRIYLTLIASLAGVK